MLEGRLVRLRALEPSDVERAYTWVNDREVTQFLLLRYPMSRTQEEKYLADAAEQGNAYADVRLAMETKDGLHIGMCGLHHTSPENRHASLGIMVGDKSYWSNGYGSDAVMTLLRFAFEEMNLNRVELGVFEFNERAIACYLKCGFVEEGRRREHYFQEGRYWDIIDMSVLRREFEAPQQNRVQAETASLEA
ncbi:MAG: GNAT family N-acetyltransferase [Chloroflexi bacterium]|nr:MAG: GNAT family N-acetyltransferase [Chloroflexota bacterium]